MAVEPPPQCPDYLGLSLLPNSHRVALGLCLPPPERARRGLKGISRHGARMVRNGAFLLSKTYGARNLAFLTFTLPAISETDQYAVGLRWAEIVRKFVQSAKRLLQAAGLSGSVVGCTEIQGGRYQKYGGMPLHLHLVTVGKRPGGSWAISADQWRALWRNALVNEFPSMGNVDFSSSLDCQGVKQDIGSYLGKYMTKGVAELSQMVKDDPGIVDFLPSSWWICSLKLRRAVGARISGGQQSASRLFRDIVARDSRVLSSTEVKVRLSDGAEVVVAIVGKLSPEGRSRYCWDGSLLKQLQRQPD